MSYWDKFEKAPNNYYWSQFEKEEPKAPQLQPLTEEQKAKPGNRLRGVFSAFGEGAEDGFASGGYNVLNGLTLGGAGWADRKYLDGTFNKLNQKVIDSADSAGMLPGAGIRAGQFMSELGGNAVGAGGAIVKGGAKLGLKGLKLALGTAAVENAGYGLTQSDSINEVVPNILLSEAIGLPLAGGMYGGGRILANKYADKAKGYLVDNAKQATDKLRGFLKDIADSKKADRVRKSIEAGATDIEKQIGSIMEKVDARVGAAKYGNKVDDELEKALMTDTMRNTKNQYGKFIAKNAKTIIPTDEMGEYFAKNPVARQQVARIRQNRPTYFKGMKENSLEFLDKLKRNLREEAGSANIDKTRSGSLKDAENDLKNLLEKHVKGFKSVNRDYAQASTKQKQFESDVLSNLQRINKAIPKDFWNGFTGGIVGAGSLAALTNPSTALAVGGVIGAKALLRKIQREAGQNIVNQTPMRALRENLINLLVGTEANVVDNYEEYLKNR